jgi:hypothetical protein
LVKSAKKSNTSAVGAEVSTVRSILIIASLSNL